MVARGRGGGKTPERVVELLQKEVSKSSQAATARATGLTLQTVQRYIQGIGEPSQATLEKLAAYFGESVARLRGEANYSPVFPILRDPRTGGDSPPAAEDIANLLRKNGDLRKEVERLLATEPTDSKKD